MKIVTSSPHVAYIFLAFFLFFLWRRPQPPPGKAVSSPDSDGERSENGCVVLASGGASSGVPSPARVGRARLRQYTAAIQYYADWF